MISSLASAHDALTLMLRAGAESVTVEDANGDHLGTVTWQTIVRAALTAQGEHT
jgi:hypothetical protein